MTGPVLITLIKDNFTLSIILFRLNDFLQESTTITNWPLAVRKRRSKEKMVFLLLAYCYVKSSIQNKHCFPRIRLNEKLKSLKLENRASKKAGKDSLHSKANNMDFLSLYTEEICGVISGK